MNNATAPPSGAGGATGSMIKKTAGRWEDHGFYRLYHSGFFSDCRIICGSKVFHGHVCIIGSACAFFEKAFCGGFKEAHDRTLDLSEEDWLSVTAMIKFIYGCPNYQLFEPSGKPWIRLIKLYALADRLGYLALKEASIDPLLTKSKQRFTDLASLRRVLMAIEQTSLDNDELLRCLAKDLLAANIAHIQRATVDELAEMACQVPHLCHDLVSMAVFPST